MCPVYSSAWIVTPWLLSGYESPDMSLCFRLLLLQEKEQLLRELRSIDPKGRSGEEMTSIRQRITQLEYDLKHALQISNKQIQERSATCLSLWKGGGVMGGGGGILHARQETLLLIFVVFCSVGFCV